MKNIVIMLFLILTAESLDSVIFKWEATPLGGIVIDHFEVKLIRENSDIVYSHVTKEPTLTIKAPKPGTYQFQFRSCKDKDCLIAMPWCNSTDPLCVDGGQTYKLQFNLTTPFIKIVKE
jgi:hypothetical protein